MKFAFHVLAPPSSPSARAAIDLAAAVAGAGHTLVRVFFSGDGVLNGNGVALAERDSFQPTQAWQRVQQATGAELVLCVSACLKRGIVSEAEQRAHQLPVTTAAEGFIVSGLGQLAEVLHQADRVVTFP